MKTEVIKLYDNRDDVTLTTYILDNSPEMHYDEKRPAVLVCPGGAYLSCSDREGEPVALAFATMGYQTFVLRYSVYGGGAFECMEEGSDLPAKPEINHPTPMREIGMAMAMIKEHSDEWLVDTERVAICGFSAGAHNCAMYSVYWDKPVIVDYLKKDKTLLKPAACILGYCLSDYTFMKENTSGSKMDRAFFNTSNFAFLGTREPSDELLDEVSPALHVDSNTPPTYLWSTAADNLVPIQHTIRMAHALADNKVPFEVHIFEEGMHGLSLSTQTTAASKAQCLPDVAKWLPLCDGWLKKRFALELPRISPFEAMMADRANF